MADEDSNLRQVHYCLAAKASSLTFFDFIFL